ncbi:MAG: nucleotidyltransferase domain-containing protein [Chitinispirillales bacterium]|nr:nucleotidyltransferase domain-containing protein [Chitinispirillales bacterium]
MNEKVKTELDNIVSVLSETGVVSKIILFGSYARGEENADSDIDLCVLTPEKDEGRRLTEISVNLQLKLFDIVDTSLDLLTYNQEEFSTRAISPRSFQHHIMEHGVVLYG